MARCRYLLVTAFALSLVVPTLARADYVYSFSAETSGGAVDTFSFTSATLIQSNTVLTSWTSCVSGGITCSFTVLDPNGLSSSVDGSTTYYDSLQIDGTLGDYYFFPSGAFSQIGQHTTDANITSALSLAFGPTIGTGTLTITNTSAVPEPSSLMLLGTGVLGCFGPIRRKLLG